MGDAEQHPVSDEERFRVLYPSLRRFAAVVGPTEDDPNDLVQEALTRTLRRGSLADLRDVERYLQTVMLRIASNRRRSLSIARRSLARLGVVASSVDHHHSDLSDLERLPPQARAVLFLVEVEGWSYRQVSELIGCSEEAARTRASRGLRQLRAALTAEEGM